MSQLAYTCTVNGREVSGVTNSKERRSAPIDAADLREVYDAARKTAGVSTTAASVTCSRLAREKKEHNEDLQWIRRRMTRSCAAYNYDPSAVVSYDRWSCSYVGQGTVVDEHGNKRMVYNPMKRYSGRIASCASLDPKEGLGISDATMRDVQTMAYHQADGDNAELDVNQFLCRVESLPRI